MKKQLAKFPTSRTYKRGGRGKTASLFPSDPTPTDKMQPKSYLCFFCKRPAPFGVGWGGLDVPKEKRASMWVCLDHVAAAVERRDLARENEGYSRIG
jgi:hypothetical protein